MAAIHFAKSSKIIQAANEKTLMQILLDNNVPVASSCHGDGVCGKCRLNIVKGFENLSKPTDLEFILKEKYQLSAQQRISCQTYVLGDVTIDASYW